MQFRLSRILSGAALLVGIVPFPSVAEDKIQAFLSSSGRVVFTNLVENTPPPPVVPPVSDTLHVSDTLIDGVPISLRTLVDTISVNYGVDPALVRAVIKAESNFNRWAISNKGALGLMQLIPTTGRRYGVQDFFDPQQNVDGGVRHLKFLLEKFKGNLDLSLAAYNSGENLVERLGRVPSIPETANYVRKVRAIYRSQPVSAPAAATIMAAAVLAAGAKQEVPKAEIPKIFKLIDDRGVTHFSNIEPPN
jgi:soluble lytic murein transglycosylase-like protein